MAYKQLIKFDRRKAGTKPYWCLRNVRMGFGIPAKYEYAWQNWKNTKQHTSPIPRGVDVPVFFSFRANLSGKYRNWGHVAVRLADGRVWTDGKYFKNVHELANLYLNNGKYVGWSESINGTIVIEKEDTVTREKAHRLGVSAYRTALHREPESDKAAKQLGFSFEKDGKITADSVMSTLNGLRGKEWQAQDRKLRGYDPLNKAHAELVKENESLRAQLGDANKWETFKALVRELIGKGL